jgi:hypothetical protein
MDSISLRKMVKSHVHLRAYDPFNKLVWEQHCSNTLTYAAANIFMSALLRSGPSQVTHLYARFGDSGANPAFLVAPNSDLKQSSRSTFIQSSNGAIGGLWVPILSAPAQNTTNNALYSGNSSTFFFRIPYNIASTQTSPANFAAVTSYIYAIGLCVAKVMSDRTQDVIISVAQAKGWNSGDLADGYFTKFPVPSGGQIAIDYSWDFNLT